MTDQALKPTTDNFKAFLAWASSHGYDCAYTYDTDRSKWLALNPMTADLWAAWQGAQAAPSTSQPLTNIEVEALAICRCAGRVSVSQVQRILSIGYNEAGEICQSIIDKGQCNELELALSLTPQAAPSTSQDMKALKESGELMDAAVEMRFAMDALKAENNRFRAALTIIGNWGGTTRFHGSGSYTDVARVALGEGGAR